MCRLWLLGSCRRSRACNSCTAPAHACALLRLHGDSAVHVVARARLRLVLEGCHADPVFCQCKLPVVTHGYHLHCACPPRRPRCTRCIASAMCTSQPHSSTIALACCLLAPNRNVTCPLHCTRHVWVGKGCKGASVSPFQALFKHSVCNLQARFKRSSCTFQDPHAACSLQPLP
jgi:hypothetical protein